MGEIRTQVGVFEHPMSPKSNSFSDQVRKSYVCVDGGGVPQLKTKRSTTTTDVREEAWRKISNPSLRTYPYGKILHFLHGHARYDVILIQFGVGVAVRGAARKDHVNHSLNNDDNSISF